MSTARADSGESDRERTPSGADPAAIESRHAYADRPPRTTTAPIAPRAFDRCGGSTRTPGIGHRLGFNQRRASEQSHRTCRPTFPAAKQPSRHRRDTRIDCCRWNARLGEHSAYLLINLFYTPRFFRAVSDRETRVSQRRTGSYTRWRKRDGRRGAAVYRGGLDRRYRVATPSPDHRATGSPDGQRG